MTHYFSEKQDGEFSPYKIKIEVAGISFEIFSASGVFSKDELDYGSRLLIELADPKSSDAVLDLGCGNGIVGISTARLHKGIKLTMADVNERAVMLAKLNAKDLRIDAECVQSDIYSGLAGKSFDYILLNPPHSAGRDICYAMIDQAKEHLNPDGSLLIVARKKKGGETLAKRMEEVFGNCEVLGRGYGFTVWKSKNI